MDNKEFNFRLPNEMGNQLEESRTISFRITKSMLSDLKELSKSGGLSVTGIVNSVLSDYVKYYRYKKKGNA